MRYLNKPFKGERKIKYAALIMKIFGTHSEHYTKILQFIKVKMSK